MKLKEVQSKFPLKKGDMKSLDDHINALAEGRNADHIEADEYADAVEDAHHFVRSGDGK